MLLLLLAMVVASGLAALANRYSVFGVPAESRPVAAFIASLIATTLVPVFLSSINSSLVRDSAADPWKLTVFFGYCVIAALVPRPFTQRMMQAMRQQVEQNTTRSENAEGLAEALLLIDKAPARDDTVPVRGLEASILRLLEEPAHRWLPVQRIRALAHARDLSVTDDDLTEILHGLKDRGLVAHIAESPLTPSALWAITPLGRISVRAQ